MVASLAPPTPVPIDIWISASWEEFVGLSDHPTHAKSKGYYRHGAMRFEAICTGSDHARDHTLIILAIGLYAMVREIPINCNDACSYRKTGHDEFQPDISCYAGANVDAIPNGTRVIDLDTYPLPNLVIEISDTTLSDDKGEKRLQYEELGISEYWIVNVKTGEILAFAITTIGGSQRIQTSQVIPGLEFSLLEATLHHRRHNHQSATLAWLMPQIQSSTPLPNH
jgi:Uma2 family endonuclease